MPGRPHRWQLRARRLPGDLVTDAVDHRVFKDQQSSGARACRLLDPRCDHLGGPPFEHSQTNVGIGGGGLDLLKRET